MRNNNTQSVLYENQDESVITVEECAYNVVINELSRVLHSFRVLSAEPDNMVAPSGEKQQQYIYENHTQRETKLPPWKCVHSMC